MRRQFFAALFAFVPMPVAAGDEVVVLPEAQVETDAVPETALATGTATVVATEELAGSGASLADAVEETPGVHVRRLGGVGSYSTATLRGIGGQNVVVVLDELPLASATLGPVDLSLFPIESLERIEVYRGSGPVRFGSPLGGVLRLVTHPPADRTRVRAHLGYGSESTRSAHVLATGPFADLRYMAFVGYQGSTGDYPHYDDRETLYNPADDVVTRRSNNGFDHLAVRILGESDGPSGSRLRLVSAGTWRAQELSGAGNQRARAASSQQVENTVRTELVELSLADARVRITTGADLLLSERHFRDPLQETGLGLMSAVSHLLQSGADLRVAVVETLAHESELAVRVSHDSFGQASPLQELAVSRGRTDLGVGLEHRAELWGGLRLVASLRVDAFNDRDGGAKATNGSQWSPRLGALWRIGPCELRGNFGRFHRLPTLVERYGDGGLTAANPELEPERGLSGDLGSRCSFAPRWVRVDLAITGFATDARKLILIWPNSPRSMRFENLSRSRILGLEASASAQARWAGAKIAYTLTDSRDTSRLLGLDGKRLPGVPMHELEAALRLGPEEISLEWETSLASSTCLDRANLRCVPTRVLHNLQARARLRQKLEALLTVRNLTNRIAEEVPLRGAPNGVVRSAMVDFLGFPLPGRTYFFSLVWRSP